MPLAMLSGLRIYSNDLTRAGKFLLGGQATRFLKRSRMTSVTEPKEVCLPVPWGHISGKAWGDPANKPVLALHGWLDNAGSFDRLAPLLTTNLYIVAMDFPGHGLSSHRPPGLVYDAYQYVADIKHMVEALKWKKFSMLAHSMGAGAAAWFSAALPDMVEGLVLLEGLGFYSTESDNIPVHMGKALNNLHKLDYVDCKTYPDLDAAIDRMIEGRMDLDKSFERERGSARDLCIRGTKRLDDGTYQFTRDVRLNLPSLLRISNEVSMSFLKAIKCPVLVIIGDSEESPWLSIITSRVSQLNQDQVHLLKVSGGHHLHMYVPERILEPIAAFFNSTQRENKL